MGGGDLVMGRQCGGAFIGVFHYVKVHTSLWMFLVFFFGFGFFLYPPKNSIVISFISFSLLFSLHIFFVLSHLISLHFEIDFVYDCYVFLCSRLLAIVCFVSSCFIV